MHTIKDAVNQIKRSIHFTDAIARQSHLLALNASIEAARLGESGKGFSIIADEMQELSLRSSHTAKETTSLIQACLMATSEGTSSIAETAQSMMISNILQRLPILYPPLQIVPPFFLRLFHLKPKS